MASFIPANLLHHRQPSSIHRCIYASLMSPSPRKAASHCTWSHLRLTLNVKAARSWLPHLTVLSVRCEPSGSTSLCIQSVVHPPSTSSSLGPTSPEPKLPQPFVLSFNVSTFLLSSMHLTASGSAPLLPQPKPVCHLGWSKRWDTGQATASASISELHLLSFRRFLRCWPHRTHQDRGDGPHYQDLIVPVIFNKRSVMLAVFGIYFWVHTCHFHLHVAGWVGPLPHLCFHSPPGGTCASLVGSSVVTLQGVWLPPLLHYSLLGYIAATLIALLIITRVCCCHPSCLHVAGCVAATPHFMLGCTQQPVVPFTAKYCVLFVCYGAC